MEVPVLGDSLSWDTKPIVCDITTILYRRSGRSRALQGVPDHHLMSPHFNSHKGCISWHRPLGALSAWPFQVKTEMRRHEARSTCWQPDIQHRTPHPLPLDFSCLAISLSTPSLSQTASHNDQQSRFFEKDKTQTENLGGPDVHARNQQVVCKPLFVFQNLRCLLHCACHGKEVSRLTGTAFLQTLKDTGRFPQVSQVKHHETTFQFRIWSTK